jgi:hypothetical protein
VAGPDWPSYHEFTQHLNVADFVYDEIDAMLSDVQQFDPPTFCVFPFYGWEYPINKPCCLLPNGYDLESIQKEMLAGQRPQACNKCWMLEDAGLESDRKIKNATLDYYSQVDLKQLYQQAQEGQHQRVNYKIDSSNVCNATCITCSSHFSSAWAQLERKNNVKPSQTWFSKPNDVDSIIDYATAESIGFRGGEPFLSDTNFHVLEQLIAHGNTRCFISFTTNGSIELTDYQKNLLKQFTNVNFCFSIDGVGPVFEYLRYPSQWHKLQSNIDYCRQNNIMISASYTVSNLNILYHNQTEAWFKLNQIPFLINLVYNPGHFRIGALSQRIKNHISSLVTDPQILALLKSHTEQDELDYQEFKIQIAKQDQWKGLDLKDYLPALASLVDQK